MGVGTSGWRWGLGVEVGTSGWRWGLGVEVGTRGGGGD